MNDGETLESFFARQAKLKDKGINGNGSGMPLTIAAAAWPTPQARDGDGRGADPNRWGCPKRHGGYNLDDRVAAWPTPAARDYKGATDERWGTNSRPLNEVAKIWSTPRASDGDKGGPNQSFSAGGVPLPAQTAQWSTPAVADVQGGRKARSGERSDELLLNGQAASLSSRQDQANSSTGETSSNSGRKLNPLFVEWLMGWPTGWTAFGCSATELSRFRRHMRSELSQLASLPAPPAQLSLFG